MRLGASVALMLVLTGQAAEQSFVTGTALYKERMALPAGAIFVATLEDVSRVGGKAQELGRATLDNPGQPPFAFRIADDTVLTGGAGSEVSMVMRRVPEGPSAPASSAGPPYYGDWRVTGFRIPGISAMTTKEAGRVVGTRASYSASAASFGTNRCAKPSYEPRALSADDFVTEYRFPPESLGLDRQATITPAAASLRPMPKPIAAYCD